MPGNVWGSGYHLPIVDRPVAELGTLPIDDLMKRLVSLCLFFVLAINPAGSPSSYAPNLRI
jgi:hypothetical protein